MYSTFNKSSSNNSFFKVKVKFLCNLKIMFLLYPHVPQLAPINIEQSFLFDICEISEVIHGRTRGVRVAGEAGAVTAVNRRK